MEVFDDINLDNEFERIKMLKKNKEIYRLGTLFNTNFTNYFFDTGTGKVLSLDDESHNVMYHLFSSKSETEDFIDLFLRLSHKDQEDFLHMLHTENLLHAPPVKNLHLCRAGTSLEHSLNNLTEQVVLEVTEKCNFRCKYCIYNEDYAGDRDFGQNDMNFETAKKAIDYLLNHSSERAAVTFYGGEPLLNFDLVKKSIDYTLEEASKRNRDNISFSITSNLTLMTKEIAAYLASIPKLGIVASLDGPEDIHNHCRVYTGGNKTFEDTMRGLKLVADAYKHKTNQLTINTVLVPPYNYEKLDRINEFFESLDFLPEDIEIQISYPTPYTYYYDKWDTIENNSIYLFRDGIDPLKKWQLNKVMKNGLDISHTRNIYTKAIYDILVKVSSRMIVDEPDDFYPCNGCCVPGARKLYVKPNGDLLTCEKIGESPLIGNIHSGIDVKVINDIFQDEYIQASLPECSKCWGINMCTCCYASIFNKDGLNIDEKNDYCKDFRENFKQLMSIYYILYEETPEAFDCIRNLKFR